MIDWINGDSLVEIGYMVHNQTPLYLSVWFTIKMQSPLLALNIWTNRVDSLLCVAMVLFL